VTAVNRDLIEQYARGGAKLAEALRGLSKPELNARPIPGTWSIQQIVIHLMDSDLIASDRMKRVIAEENPTIIGFDETKFAEKLLYDEQSLEEAVTIFTLNRRNTAKILRGQPDSAYQRKGTHNERGPVTLLQLLETYTQHLEHHLQFILKKRAILGKPLR
jgi:uncharacterized damage-inducible protein DinB